jgi:Flp pilus assembly protein protease CpaA
MILLMAARSVTQFQQAQMLQTMFAWLIAAIVVLIIFDLIHLGGTGNTPAPAARP